MQEALKLIQRSENICILLPISSQGDNFSSALALFLTLKKLGKNVNLLINKIPEKFQFLLKLQPKDFVVTTNTKLQKNPDLLITLGVQNLENLGEVFTKNPSIFYETPILNIDNQLANENFGEVNLIDITSPSLAEILTEFIKTIDEKILDSEISSFLLAGVVWSSENFQNSKTTPRTFRLASYLIEKGADHQKIIQHLYKTKSLSQIKLLGRVLEKINFDEKRGLAWAALKLRDFQELEADSRDLDFVIKELKLNFWQLPSLMILWESHDSELLIKGIFYSLNKNLQEKILENFEGIAKKEEVIFFMKDTSLEFALEKILNILCSKSE